jgi:hypothetical protein
MNLDEFKKSLSGAAPPGGLSVALAALWWDAKGDWAQAHESAQKDAGLDGAWVHAYLHRKEGDLSKPHIGTGVHGSILPAVLSPTSGIKLLCQC